MTKRKKIRFFFRHFLSASFAIAITAYFKVNHHEHADMALLVACLYSLIVFIAFVRFSVSLRKRKVRQQDGRYT